jgi:hypothetical protein
MDLATDNIFRPIMSRTLTLKTGRQYLASGRWTGTSDMGSLMGCRIEAYPVGATDAGQRIRSSLATRNHLGTENGLPPGEQCGISTDWLLEVPVDGDYVVDLRGQAGRVGHPEYFMSVVHGPGTYLTATDHPWHSGGLEWQQPTDVRFGNPHSTVMPRPRAVDVLWRTHEVPPGTTTVKVWTGTEISCESTGGASPLRVRVKAFARQLNPAGAYCNVGTAVAERPIPGKLHHYRFNQWITLDLLDTCGTNQVNVKVYVEYLPAGPGEAERHGGVVHAGPYTAAHIIPMP